MQRQRIQLLHAKLTSVHAAVSYFGESLHYSAWLDRVYERSMMRWISSETKDGDLRMRIFVRATRHSSDPRISRPDDTGDFYLDRHSSGLNQSFFWMMDCMTLLAC